MSNNQNPLANSSETSVLDLTNGMEDVVIDPEPSSSDLLKELRLIRKAADSTNNKLDEYTARNDVRLSAVEKKSENNRNQLLALREEIAEMKKISLQSATSTEKSKQQQLQNNFTLMGLPPACDDEDTIRVVIATLDCFGVSIDRKDIIDAYRVANSRNNLIVVKCSNLHTKLAVMQQKQSAEVFLSHIYDNVTKEEDARIFINNHVTPYFGKMLQVARGAISAGKIQSCWINSNGLMVRFKTNELPKSFLTLDELNAYINTDVNTHEPTVTKNQQDNRTQRSKLAKTKLSTNTTTNTNKTTKTGVSKGASKTIVTRNTSKQPPKIIRSGNGSRTNKLNRSFRAIAK